MTVQPDQAFPSASQAPAGWPAVGLAEAQAALTAPGALFEMESLHIGGRAVRAWRHGPKVLPDLVQAARAFGDRTFIVHEDERVSFEAFARAASHLARRLVEDGVAQGDRVAVVMRNLPEWPVAFYGAVLAGAVIVPLNAWGSADELAFGLADSGAVAAILDQERLSRLEPRVGDLTQLRSLYVCRRGSAPGGAPATDLEAVIGPPAAWADLPADPPPRSTPAPDDLATIFYTSGTTGSPKGAPASHRAATTAVLSTLYSQARAYVRRGEPVPSPDPQAAQKAYIVSIPFFHVTGCFALLDVALAAGMKLVLMRRFDPEAVMALVAREGVTAIGGVPTIAWQVLEHPARAGYDLSSLEAVTYGGAPAAPELVRRITSTWPRALPSTGWGMTETSATFTHHVGEDYMARPDSCGLASPVNELRIVDPHGRALAPGEVGEMWVRGPGVIAGYWHRPAESASAFEDGWLKTGDLARVDDEGFCYIVDRLKDVVIRGGENIYSVEVEDALYAHPDVMDAAVLALPHPTLGEEPGAVVTLKPGAAVGEAELQGHVRARLAAYKTPVRVLIQAEALPRNANGKIVKATLKPLFASE